MHTLKNKQIQTNTTLGSWLVFRKWDHKMTIKRKAPHGNRDAKELKLETNQLQQNVKQPKSDRQQQYQMQNRKNHTNRLHKRQRMAAKACKITKIQPKCAKMKGIVLHRMNVGPLRICTWGPHSFFICQWLLGKEKERKKNALRNRRQPSCAFSAQYALQFLLGDGNIWV